MTTIREQVVRGLSNITYSESDTTIDKMALFVVDKLANGSIYDLLSEIEWQESEENCEDLCMACARCKTEGHSSECKLGAILAELNQYRRETNG